ncbi:long-chain-fatty-acid--CoA ligase [Nocardia uniformis]|uniref:Long-chain-fatty-acid--CoA ligase n=1 Tax=Nocardia uniformis TaxID=53432 RepID=A0A849BQ67_9NOCA|nr:long-chain-fatty-acid--CoA ligase [Nocardia uniformis]NNH68852.1 long-chain-fatty-acid--CoA ligase [Nocardia uniformis]
MTKSAVPGADLTTAGLSAAIAEHAARRPDLVALVCAGRETTFGALHRISCQVANALQAEGLAPGARVGYLGRDSERLYQLLIAAADSGLVLVPLNWRLASTEIEYILRDSECELLFVDAADEPLAAQAMERMERPIGLVRMDRDGVAGAGFTAWHAPYADYRLPTKTSRQQALLQMYTSGTTGHPKGVVIAQQSLFAVREVRDRSSMPWLQPPPDDRCLVLIPGFHIAGLAWAVQGLLDAVTTVILPEYTPPAALAAIRTFDITAVCAVPVMLLLVIAEPGVTPADFAGLRQVAYGGSPIPEDMLNLCMTVYGCEFLQFYGMTETATPITFLPPADHTPGSPRLRSSGTSYADSEILILDKAGNPLPPGEIGEVVVRGPAMMLEYFNRPDATAATLVDGWIHTGDAGRLDEDGYLFICDRLADMIIVGGENVYPAEVENVLVAHPAVREAAVVGAPDDRWGERLHAFVAFHPGQSATPHELMMSIRDKLASFKLPQHIEVLDALPRNASGKILRRTLREPLWQGRDRAVN